jgi:hypothetical protein
MLAVHIESIPPYANLKHFFRVSVPLMRKLVPLCYRSRNFPNILLQCEEYQEYQYCDSPGKMFEKNKF